MVLQVPNFDDLITRNTYTNLFRLTLMWNVGVYGLIVFGVFVLFLSIKLYHLYK
jgi:hypothetical protein